MAAKAVFSFVDRIKNPSKKLRRLAAGQVSAVFYRSVPIRSTLPADQRLARYLPTRRAKVTVLPQAMPVDRLG